MIFRSRKIIKSADLNGGGSLFGGQALAWIDEEAAIFAMCQIKATNLVTKTMSAIDFKAPAKLGDVIEIGCSIVRFGTSSVTVSCTMRNKTTKQDILTVDRIVFVNLDAEGHPTPHNVTEESNDV